MSSGTRDYMITVAPHAENQKPNHRISAIIRQNEEFEPRIIELAICGRDPKDDVADTLRSIDIEQLQEALLSTVAAFELIAGAPDSLSDKQNPRRPTGSNSEKSPYRKMPDAGKVKSEFLKTGSVGQLAKHFGVPRYTAQAWVGRLRRAGVLAPVSRKPRT
ncbi:helix-turn-helix domain-containing protein [Nocardia sp. NPDC006044]|uniref:helix-turn-helix domain-containing protein n=1 Tax=Nocardia sp. NPDC006044 TaxID=3364306 RepID=UPI0036BF814C